MRIPRTYHPLLVFLGAAILLFTLGTYEQSVDSYGYAGWIKEGKGLFHPHHIAYNWVNHLLMKLLNGIGWGVDAMQVGRGHNIICGSITVAFFFSMLRRLGNGLRLSGLLAFALLMCFGFWKLSAVVEVYVPGLMFMTLAAWWLAGLSAERFRWQDAAALAFFLLGAVAYHQANVLFCFPIWVYLVLLYGRAGWLHAAKVLVPAGAMSLGLYVMAAPLMGYPASFDGVYQYMFRYSIEEHPGWGSWANLGLKGWFALMKSQIAGFVLSRYAAVFLYQLLYGGALVGVLVWNVKQVVRGKMEQGEGVVRKTMLAWLAAHFLFFCWWLPQESEFFVVSLVPLIVLIAFTLRDAGNSRRGRRALPIFFGLLFLLQLGLNSQYIFLQRAQHREPQLRADAILEACPDRCFLVDDMHSLGMTRFLYGYPGKELILAMRPAYGFEPESPVIDYAAQPCVLLEFERTTPRADHMGRNGFTHPGEWWRYFSRLADLQATPTGAYQARIIIPLRIRDRLYLKFLPDRHTISQPREIVSLTATAIHQLGGAADISQQLQDWLSASPADIFDQKWQDFTQIP